ncbi:MAG: hypothetical protein QOG10_7060 [Kribbellaceae bacterium]|nr:hypothetical protein [Kribbellaceae bacterium]
MARKPGRPADQGKRRQEIVTGAANLFNTKGFHQTSMDDIADTVGIAKPTLYHYFSGKAEILAEIHEEFIADMLSRLRGRQSTDLTPPEQLRELVGDIFMFIEKRRGHVKVFYEHEQDLTEESRAHISKLRTEFTNQVRALIQAGIDSGEFRDVDTQLAARALFGMCNWSYHWFRTGRDNAQRTADFMYATFVNGLHA